jgi:hypothetical protein
MPGGIGLTERAIQDLREIKKKVLGLNEGDAELDRFPEAKDLVVAKPTSSTMAGDGTVTATLKYPYVHESTGAPSLATANGSGDTCYLVEVNNMSGA